MQIIISTQGYLSTQRIRCSDWSPGPVWTMWKLLTGVSPYNGQFNVVTLISHILPGGFVWELFSRYLLSLEVWVCELGLEFMFYFIVFYFDSLFRFSHPDLHTKDGAEFLRVSAAYQRILNKKTIIYDVPQGPQRHYYRPDIRAYPGETFMLGRIFLSF